MSQEHSMKTYGRDAVIMNTQRIPFSAPLTTAGPVRINQHEIKLEQTNKTLASDHQLNPFFTSHQEKTFDKQECASNPTYIYHPDESSFDFNIQSNPGYLHTADGKSRNKNKTVLTFVRPSPRRHARSTTSLVHSSISKTRRLANLAKTFKLSISDTALSGPSVSSELFICRTPVVGPSRTFEGARFLFCKTRWKRSAIESFVVPKESLCHDDDDLLSPLCHDMTAKTMEGSKPLSKCLERQAAIEEDDVIGLVKREYITYDDRSKHDVDRVSHSSVSSQFDIKTDECIISQERDPNVTQQTKDNNEITVITGHDSPKIDLPTTGSIQNVIDTTADQEACTSDTQKTPRKFNRVKLALATSHAGIFVTGDSQDDPSSDSPMEHSFDTCPSWMGSHEVSTSFLTPHYQPSTPSITNITNQPSTPSITNITNQASTSSNEMEPAVTCLKRKGASISLISTRQTSNSSEKDSYPSLSPNSKTSGYSVHDSGFEASGRHSNALLSPSFRQMNMSLSEKSADHHSSDEYFTYPSEEVSITNQGRTRRRKIADLSSCRRGKVDLLSPSFHSKSADSNESGKSYLYSSGDSGLDTPAASLSPRSPRPRRPDRSSRYSSQSKMSSKSSIKSDNSSFLSFLSPKAIRSRRSSSSEVCRQSNSSKSSRKRLSDFPDDEKLLTLNVSGRTFKLHEYFTSVYPETLLGNSKRNTYFDKKKDEYFFDRDPDIFRHIWNFYYTGKLHFPKDECVNLFLDEIAFFDVSEDYLCTCCWEDEYEPAKEKLEKRKAELQRQEEARQETKREMPKEASLREKLWLTTKHPMISLQARVLYFFSILAIVISTIANIIETIPCSTAGLICKKNNKEIYFYIDAACVSFFTVEYVINLAAAPKTLAFIRQFMSVIDLLAIVPFYCDLLIRVIFGTAAGSGIEFLEILRILRIVRIFKLLKNSERLQALVHTFRSSTKELGLILMIYMVLVTVFSSVIYYAEMQDNPKYSSIPESMWYAVITTTTTGYGDIVPETVLGKLVGCACCLLGVLIIALPVPILQMR